MKNNEMYEKLCEELCKIRGAEVYDACDEDEDPYVELAVVTNANIDRAKQLIEKFGCKVTDEGECNGSDYYSYCIWFSDTEKEDE